MKKTSWILAVIIFTSLEVKAQNILDALSEHQGSLEPEVSAHASQAEVKNPDGEVEQGSVSSSTTQGICEEPDQKSIPLAYLTSLIQVQNGKLETNYDPRRGALEVSSPDMISNCSSMFKWNLREQTISGQKVYAVEAKFKNGENCNQFGCEYKVAIVGENQTIKFEQMVLKPTLEGFEDCLKRSGVIKDGRVQKASIYTAPVKEKFSEVYSSGKVLFVSHGPRSPLIKPKYGDFKAINKCDYYEEISSKPKSILSMRDEQKRSLDEEVEKLKQCSVNEYHKVADFVDKYQGYSKELEVIRDKLILENVKKAAKAIDAGKYTEEDLKILQDFNKYVVMPKADRIAKLYDEIEATDNPAEKAAKNAELKNLKAELKALNGKPYFLSSHVLKLVKNGQFEDAEKMNTIKLVLDSFSKVGNKNTGNTKITPDMANSMIAKSRDQFASQLEVEKENYAIRTGELTGKSAYYKSMSDKMKYNIQVRTQNFNDEIAAEYARIQPGGYCYAYFRNTQKCIQDSMERIQELQGLLQHYNQVDTERAKEYDEKFKEYSKLEAEGRRYVAAQNGEEPPAEEPAEEQKPNENIAPTRRSSSGSYSFDYRPQQSPSPQQQMPAPSPMNMYQSGMFQQPSNPYQSYGYQQPFMGQQSYPGYGSYGGYPGAGSYSFQWGGMAQSGYGNPYSMGYGQPSTGGYWSQPYGAYNMYSMYGR